MKKRNWLVGLLMLLSVSVVNAQAYSVGSKIIMFGIGPGGESPSGQDYQTSYDQVATPFITALNFQYGIHEYISIGGYISGSRAKAHTTGYRTYWSNEDNTFANGNIQNDYVEEYTEMDRVRTTIYYGVKAEGHFSELIGLTDKLDLYSGLSLGLVSRNEKLKNGITKKDIVYNNNSSSTTSTSDEWDSSYDPGDSPLDWNLFLGARYYFNEQLGGYLELGARYTYLQIGVSYKL